MPTDPAAWGRLAQVLAPVAARLEPREAAQAASTLTWAMSKTTYPLRGAAAKGLAATLTESVRSIPPRVAYEDRDVAASDRQPLLAPAALDLARELPTYRFSTQALVELLKHPLCVDQARSVVLDQLAQRYRRPFADHWEFVRFAHAQNLGLDFTTPPRRPESPAPEMRK
jgi:hypothetical protein